MLVVEHSPAVRSPGATAVGRGYKHQQAVVLRWGPHQNMWYSNWTVSEIVKKIIIISGYYVVAKFIRCNISVNALCVALWLLS